jgi:hypothetical protein
MESDVLDDVVDSLYLGLTRWPGDLATIETDDIRVMLTDALREADAVILGADELPAAREEE